METQFPPRLTEPMNCASTAVIVWLSVRMGHSLLKPWRLSNARRYEKIGSSSQNR